MRSRLTVVGIALGFALLTLIPYAIAYGSAGSFRFIGFLFGPYDAASYLAKMRQGFDGGILYTLAFTENPGPGALIFTYYLFLGQLARVFHLPLIGMWQIARVLGATFFLTVVWEFFGRLGFSPRGRAIAWIIAALGSGFGFFVVPLGSYTADLWVSEYIPFLGMFTSAHFPLATAIILLLVMQIALPAHRQTIASLAVIFFLGLALGVLQPFGFLPLGMALVIWSLWLRVEQGRFPEGAVAGIIAAGLGVFPWVAYDLWVTRTLPQFASWFAQNQTPTPPVWDVALSLGLPGLIAGIYFVRWILNPTPLRSKIQSLSSGTLLLGLWLAINLVLLYAPLPLQRRLMLGMWVPLAALAAPKLEGLLFRPTLRRRYALYAILPLVASNLVFLSAVRINALGHNPILFLNPDTAAAVDWLADHARSSVVLASPELSKWLPGLADVRVVYGHPMETPDAVEALSEVEAFFQPGSPDGKIIFLQNRGVNWIICTQGEPGCDFPPGEGLVVVFTSGDVRVFAVRIR